MQEKEKVPAVMMMMVGVVLVTKVAAEGAVAEEVVALVLVTVVLVTVGHHIQHQGGMRPRPAILGREKNKG